MLGIKTKDTVLKVSNYSSLFGEAILEEIKKDPSHENLKIYMKEVVKSVLEYGVNPDYIINTLGKIIEYFERKSNVLADDINPIFIEVFEFAFSQYILKERSQEEICELASGFINFKTEIPHLNFKITYLVLCGLHLACGEKYDTSDLCFKLFVKKLENLKIIIATFLYCGDNEGLLKMLNTVTGKMNEKQFMPFIKNVIKILKSKGLSNDEICLITDDLTLNNQGKAHCIMQVTQELSSPSSQSSEEVVPVESITNVSSASSSSSPEDKETRREKSKEEKKIEEEKKSKKKKEKREGIVSRR